VRVLIVENQPVEAEALAAVLKGEGASVSLCFDIQQAMATACAEDFDLVVASGEHAPALTRALRAQPWGVDLPVLLISSIEGSSNISEGLFAGADGFVARPWDSGVLIDRIQRLTTLRAPWETAPIDMTVFREARLVEYLSSAVQDVHLARMRERAARDEAEDLRDSERFLQATVDALPARVGILNHEGRLIGTNRAWAADPGPLFSEAGAHWLAEAERIVGPELAEGPAMRIRDVFTGQSPMAAFQIRLPGEHGPRTFRAQTVPLPGWSPPRAVLAFEEITALASAQEQLRHDARHDALTGLPNRVLFQERLELAARRARRAGHRVAVLFIDLDDFKLVNDSLGHSAGDALLVDVGRRLLACVREMDTPSRLSGDELALLLEPVESPTDALRIAERLSELLRDPVEIEGRTVVPRASIGLAISEPGGEGADTLLRDADVAMYRAKAQKAASMAIFDQAMHEESVARLTLEHELRRALDGGELRVHYQPIIDLESMRVTSVEALVRWQHPEQGLLPPATFLTAAEEAGVIDQLGRWVLDHAVKQAASWEAQLGERGAISLAVNLSPTQLTPALVGQVTGLLHHTGFPAERLVLEVTENAVLDDSALVQATIEALQSQGVRFAMDDFGTGYSSLAVLRTHRLDVLKIDRTFVAGLPEDRRGMAILDGVVRLGRAMGMVVVAEGVERADQFRVVRALGCNSVQGFLLARPMPADQVPGFLGRALALNLPGPVAG
jgi:diguanylate cyclase (GGDEF)-like protein